MRSAGGGRLDAVDGSTRGAVAGITAAMLFGASTPLAKQLLGDVRPQLLAGLLYLGAAAALTGTLALRRSPVEARLRSSDGPTLAAVTVAGGVIAPVLLLIGLERVSGVAASLLLNLEAVATLVLALVIFGEHLSRRAGAGAAAVVIAAGVLGLSGGEARLDAVGVVCITAACVCWAIDNNLTQRLSDRDPFAIVRVKTAAAGAVNLILAVGFGAARPAAGIAIAALALGGAAYGVSVVLDAYALRWVGAARESAYFGTAPLFGVAAAVIVLGETVSPTEMASIGAMGLGVYLLVTEDHQHSHQHAPIEHDHRHRHDDNHHDHAHEELVDEHSHPHVHLPATHAHAHASDVHHRHGHRT